MSEHAGNMSVTVGSTRLPERCGAQVLYFVAPDAYNKKPVAVVQDGQSNNRSLVIYVTVHALWAVH